MKKEKSAGKWGKWRFFDTFALILAIKMDIRTFYFTGLSSISFFSGLLLWIIWRKIKETLPNQDHRGILFLSLTQFSWVALGLYTLLGSFSTSNPIVVTTVNGIMSSLNNIFLIICMAYFQGFEGVKQRIPVLRDKEKWILTTFIFFVVLLMLLLILDNVEIQGSMIGKYLVTIISICVSIFTAIVSYYGIGASFRGTPYARPLFVIAILVGVLLIVTQLGFGYRNWIKIGNPQSENPYRDWMRVLFLISISWTSFLNLLLGKHWAEEAEKERQSAPNIGSKNASSNLISTTPSKLLPQKLYIIYDTKMKHYILRLEAEMSESKETIILERVAEKLFLPFVYWLYFGIAKKKNILIRHEEIQVWKNRMGTYLNDKNEYYLDAFVADGGKYELNIEAEDVFFEGLEVLKEKQSVKDIFSTYLLDTTDIEVSKYQRDKQYKAKVWEEIQLKLFDVQ